jgi:hypothetical protein
VPALAAQDQRLLLAGGCHSQVLHACCRNVPPGTAAQMQEAQRQTAKTAEERCRCIRCSIAR